MKRLMVLMVMLFCMCGNAWGLSTERSGLIYYPTNGSAVVSMNDAIISRGYPAHMKITHKGGVSTAYVIPSGVTFPEYLTIEFENYAMFMPASGVTVRPYRPSNMISSPTQQIYDVSSGGAILYQETGTEYPERFGGFGDGTDITTEVVAMANSLDIDPTAIPDGGILKFGAGTYKFNLQIPDRQSIHGIKQTDTILTPAINDAVIKNNPLEYMTYVEFRNFRIAGNPAFNEQDGIRIQIDEDAAKWADNITLSELDIRNCGRYGAYLSGNTDGDGFIQGVYMEHCSITGCARAGLYTEGHIYETVVNACQIAKNGDATYPNLVLGRLISSRASRVTFTGGWINCGGDYVPGEIGAYIDGAQQVSFTGVDFEESDTMVKIVNNLTQNISFDTCNFGSTELVTYGILLEGCNGLSVDNCKFTSNDGMEYGIYSNASPTAVNRLDIADNNLFLAGVTTAVSYRQYANMSSGEIPYYRDYIRLNTESGATYDVLDSIHDMNGGTDALKNGDMVTLKLQTTTRLVDIPDSTGNIKTASGTTVNLNDIYDIFQAVWDSGREMWIQTN